MAPMARNCLLSLVRLGAAAALKDSWAHGFHESPNVHRNGERSKVPLGSGPSMHAAQWKTEEGQHWNPVTGHSARRLDEMSEKMETESLAKNPYKCGDGNNFAAEGRQIKVRGPNLGGWLVLEPWITPSLFYQFLGATAAHGNDAPNRVGMDMYTFCKGLGPEEANRQLRRHWRTWVTEQDFKNIAATGADAIRIPVGDWMYSPYGPYKECTAGSKEELDRAFRLAHKYNLRVLLDIHAVRGSQNGFDNSGQAADVAYTSIAQIVPIATTTFMHWPLRAANWIGTWNRLTANYTSINYANLDHTLSVMQIMVDTYRDEPAVWGIEPVNEPWEYTPIKVLQQFYWDAYQIVQEGAPHWMYLVHDAFRLHPWFWDGFMAGCPNVAIDTHIYQAWNQPSVPEEFYGNACGMVDTIAHFEAIGWSIITGEWSLATDNCAMWLNGFQDNLPGFPKVFCSYVPCAEPYMGKEQPNAPPKANVGPADPYGTGASMPMWGLCPIGQDWAVRGYDNNEVMRELGHRKIYAFDQVGAGWFFWNFKTELEDRWDFLESWRKGWLPANLSEIDTNPDVINACAPDPLPEIPAQEDEAAAEEIEKELRAAEESDIIVPRNPDATTPSPDDHDFLMEAPAPAAWASENALAIGFVCLILAITGFTLWSRRNQPGYDYDPVGSA